MPAKIPEGPAKVSSPEYRLALSLNQFPKHGNNYLHVTENSGSERNSQSQSISNLHTLCCSSIL